MPKILIPNIKERQMASFSFDAVPLHEMITVNEFYNDVFRTYMQDGKKKAFLVGKDKEKSFSVRTLERYLQTQRKFTYFTPALYWHHKKRTKEHMLWIMELTLEFDLTKDGTNRNYSAFQLFNVIRAELGFNVNYIWDTNTEGHYAVSFLLHPLGCSPKSIYLYEAIAKRMAILVGADVSAVNANNLYRKPTGLVYKFTDEIYDIDDFKVFLENEEVDALLKKAHENNVVSITEKRIWNDPSVQKLLKAEFGQFRNHAAFTIALLYYALGYEPEDALAFFYEPQEDGVSWWQKVNSNHLGSHYFPKKEITTSVKSAFSGKYHGPSREWLYIITGLEFPFNLYKSTHIQGSGKTGRVNLKGTDVQRKIIAFIRENDGITIKQPELAERLGVPKRSLEKELAVLKERGLIDWTAQKGRYAKGSTFSYVYEDEHGFTAELDVSYRENGLEEYFSKKMGG